MVTISHWKPSSLHQWAQGRPWPAAVGVPKEERRTLSFCNGMGSEAPRGIIQALPSNSCSDTSSSCRVVTCASIYPRLGTWARSNPLGGWWHMANQEGGGFPGKLGTWTSEGQPDAKQNGHVGTGPITRSHWIKPTTESQSNFRNGPNETDPTQCPRTTLKMGSMNVRTLSEAGALNKLDEALATLSRSSVRDSVARERCAQQPW